jgi:hypothetical protein
MDFIDTLNNDINKYSEVISNSDKFIKYHDLVYYHIDINSDSNVEHNITDKLPINVNIGSIYLIKNNNIVHFYSYHDEYYNSKLSAGFINFYKPSQSNINTVWVCKHNIINVDNVIELSPAISLIKDMCAIYELDDYIYIIIEFMLDGFKLYI